MREKSTNTHSDSDSYAPLEVGILVYSGVSLLDYVAPHAALGLLSHTYLIARTMDTLFSDTGLPIQPTATYATVPPRLDVLLVPGGLRSNDLMQDAETLSFLRGIAPECRYVTSVCSGSLILGAAGLLRGYEAATHWSSYEALEALGAKPVHSRVVADRNRWTGGGVTAGLDFGLKLLCELRGEMTAKVTQLAMEYDPQPPFNVGSPESAGPELTSAARSLLGTIPDDALRIARSISSRES